MPNLEFCELIRSDFKLADPALQRLYPNKVHIKEFNFVSLPINGHAIATGQGKALRGTAA
jgi:hypothetical protein